MDTPDNIPELLGAKRCSARETPNLHLMVGQLSDVAGIPAPAVYLLDSLEPNAMATGSGPDTAAVTVTTALLERLDGRELRAVLAHEIGHIAHDDIAEATSLAREAAVSAGVLRAAARTGAFLSRATGNPLVEDWLALGAGKVVTAAGRQRAVATITGFSRIRERHADEFAVRAGSGPWLASALLKMDAAVAPPAGQRLPQWCRILLLADPHAAFRTHPPTLERIAAIPPFAFNTLGEASCPTCASPLTDAHDCTACGQAAPRRSCGCGAALGSDDRFCHQCGVAVDGQRCRGCRRHVAAGHSCPACDFPLP